MLQRLAPLFIFLLLVPIASAQFPIKIFSEKDFFVTLEENTNQCLTDCHAVFRLKNPFGFSIPIGKLLGFRFEGQASKLKQYKVFIEKTTLNTAPHSGVIFKPDIKRVDTIRNGTGRNIGNKIQVFLTCYCLRNSTAKIIIEPIFVSYNFTIYDSGLLKVFI